VVRSDSYCRRGIHNSKLEESTLRILEGGSWKKQDTVILLPAAKMVPMKAALSWMNLMTPPNQSCPKIAMLGMEVGDAYSQAIQQVLDHPQLSTHRFILTLEHDKRPPRDGLLKLLAQMEAHPEFACIGGLYWTKGPGGVPQIWGDPKDPIVNFRPQPPDHKGGLVECCGTGMGFNLWRRTCSATPGCPSRCSGRSAARGRDRNSGSGRWASCASSGTAARSIARCSSAITTTRRTPAGE
jgi:hypothetical protein